MSVSGPARAETELEQTLYDAAERALMAPSILNTQPWHWRIHRASLDLYADTERQLHSIDPDGRLLILSCGGALQHACVGLRAHGLEPDVLRSPEPGNADLLARIRPGGPHAVSHADLAQARSIRDRRTDRRLIAAQSRVSAHDIDRLRQAAAEYGPSLHQINDDQRHFLASAATIAQATETDDDAYQRDLVSWTDDRARDEGVPVETLVANVTRPVPLRDFAGGGETGLHAGLGDDEYADFLILATSGDQPEDWLSAGEAMCAAWLMATDLRIAVSVLSDVIEVPAARAIVDSLLPQSGYAQLVLRIGIAAHPTPPPASPRRTPDAVIDIDHRD